MAPTSGTPRARGARVARMLRRAMALTAAALVVTWWAGPTGAADGTDAGTHVVGEVRYDARDQRDAWTGRAPLHVEVFEVDPADLGRARVEASVRVAELRSGNAIRDFHARSSLFAAGDHPEVRFRLGEVVGTLDPERRDAQTLEVVGALTLRDVTREVRSVVTVRIDDAFVHATARFELSLAAFDLSPPRFLTLVVEDAVGIEVDASWPRDPGSTTTTR